jgi:osmotically inducible lipoprotein OsmB
MRKRVMAVLIGILALSASACTLLGAGAGAVVGHEITHTPAGTIGGAVVGGVIGHEIGK